MVYNVLNFHINVCYCRYFFLLFLLIKKSVVSYVFASDLNPSVWEENFLWDISPNTLASFSILALQKFSYKSLSSILYIFYLQVYKGPLVLLVFGLQKTISRKLNFKWRKPLIWICIWSWFFFSFQNLVFQLIFPLFP